ncbi:MAG: TfoX/Sxy family protein [Bacteroidia bacterium]|nr:TfoX/Sxy family protein [Bacteroidia bacterium]
MAYNEALGERIASILTRKGVPYLEKHMFGGVAFMVDDKMTIGIVKEELMARVGPVAEAAALQKEGARIMDFAGRPMAGYVYVAPDAIDTDDQLEYWVDLCLQFNPLAKASKKKKK